MSEAGIGQLRWRCRRGMRELDQLLGWYLDNCYAHADSDAQTAFSELLEQQDPDLWDWVNGRGHPDNPAWQRIVDEIRTRNRV